MRLRVLTSLLATTAITLASAVPVAAATVGTTAAAVLYAPAVGGTDRDQRASASAQAAGVTSWVVTINWQTLQPDGPADSITKGTRLQALTSAVGSAGSAHSVIKLRILAGINAPVWAKQLGGAAVHLVNSSNAGLDQPVTIGRFWMWCYPTPADDGVCSRGGRQSVGRLRRAKSDVSVECKG